MKTSSFVISFPLLFSFFFFQTREFFFSLFPQHDAEFDHYGKRVATASSDRVIKIFEVAGDAAAKVADLRRHEGPVWQVSWAHPRFGSLLASCGYDRRVVVWKEESPNTWSAVHEYTGHTLSGLWLFFPPLSPHFP